MNELQEVLEQIKERSRFVLCTHTRPDGDAIGSVLALSGILRTMGKSAEVVISDSVPVIYRPLPFAETIVQASSVNGHYDAAILLECDSVQRTRIQGLEKHFLINIDHHASSRNFAQVNWIDPGACATAEMVFRLGAAAGVKITPAIATCLYTAVLTDTGSFCYASTTAATFELARQLVDLGADPGNIAQNIYFSNPIGKVRVMGAALSTLRCEGPVSWITLDREQIKSCGALDEDCEGVVNYALGIAGIEVGLFFRETSDLRIRVSIRSKGAVDVASIAAELGGGGHECASGFSMEGPMQSAVDVVLARLRKKHI
jgi:phosphoesterase RecJ-like protein